MAKLNLSQAAKVTGKNRTTIWRHINSGKLSSERDRDGLPFVDTSELIRVYGELTSIATGTPEKKSHQATHEYQELIATVELLRKEQAEMKKQIENLTNRIGYTATRGVRIEPDTVIQTKPEDDPKWPKEIRTMADIALRHDLKALYE
jgi:hypothetical protein